QRDRAAVAVAALVGDHSTAVFHVVAAVAVKPVLQRVAVGQCGGQAEHLECRTGPDLGLGHAVVLVLQVVQPADHRPDLAGRRVGGDHADVRVLGPGLRPVIGHRPVRGTLHVAVDGGDDPEPTRLYLVIRTPGRVQLLLDRADDVALGPGVAVRRPPFLYLRE